VEETSRLATPSLSRRGLFKSGLIVGLGVAGLSAASTALTAGVARASQNTSIGLKPDYEGAKSTEVQTQWAYCGQCRNVWYTAEGLPYCAAFNFFNTESSLHTKGSPTDYGVIIDNPGFPASPPSGYNAYLQSPWYWCSNCSCLFWGNGQAESWCPAGYNSNNPSQQYPHINSGSVYYMPYGVESGGGAAWTATSGATLQQGWKYCNLCKCLYWGNAQAESYCQYQLQNSGGTYHATGSSVYYVAMMSS
jgi:hypothetical protein